MAISRYQPTCSSVALRHHVTDRLFLKGCCKTRHWILCKRVSRGSHQTVSRQLSSRTPVSSGLHASFFKIISASSFRDMSFSADLNKKPHSVLHSLDLVKDIPVFISLAILSRSAFVWLSELFPDPEGHCHSRGAACSIGSMHGQICHLSKSSFPCARYHRGHSMLSRSGVTEKEL